MVSRIRSQRSGRTRYRRRWYTRIALVLIFLGFVRFSFLPWMLPAAAPRPKFLTSPSCRDAAEGYVLDDTGICTQTCRKLCFPRVHGICFSHTEVTVCDGQRPLPQDQLPSQMRFYMEEPRKRIPVRRGFCPGWNSSSAKATGSQKQGRWIRGLQMVADLTLMPTGKVGPNPHHEAEKVVPAIIFSQLSEFQNSSLYWFANPDDPFMISKWSLGLLRAFADVLTVNFLRPVAKNEPPICFEDTVLFTGLTHSGYIPNYAVHDWFRNRLLKYCNIPVLEANSPVQDVVIVHRPNSSRNFWNYEDVKEMFERNFQLPTKMAIPGPWDFCEQVKLVAEADILLTPHGSQNANLLVVRPGATVLEVFPLLYHIDWYGHYLHAGRIRHYELYGTWLEKGGMPLRMRIYAYLYGWERCFFVRHCMNYAKGQKIHVNLAELELLLQKLGNECQLILPRSKCLRNSTEKALSTVNITEKAFSTQ